MPRLPPISVHASEDDHVLFTEAMHKEGMDKIGPWMKRAARLHAKAVLEGAEKAEVLHAIDSTQQDVGKVSEQCKEGFKEVVEMLRDMQDPNRYLEG